MQPYALIAAPAGPSPSAAPPPPSNTVPVSVPNCIIPQLLEMMRKDGFEKPLSIQAQALPIIMSGRWARANCVVLAAPT